MRWRLSWSLRYPWLFMVISWCGGGWSISSSPERRHAPGRAWILCRGFGIAARRQGRGRRSFLPCSRRWSLLV
jgi:hypothetical protein